MIRYIKENNEDIIEIPLECIKGATLLSKEEYEKYKNNILLINECWWLRSIGNDDRVVCSVDFDGDVYSYCRVCGPHYGIRPVLILNLQSFNLTIEDKFKFGEHIFTILSKDLALCDDFIGKGYFRADWISNDANIYEKSDAKKIVDNWFNIACINIESNAKKEFDEFNFGF